MILRWFVERVKKIRWIDDSGKLSKTSLLIIGVGWLIICSIALSVGLNLVSSTYNQPEESSKEFIGIGENIAEGNISNVKDLWFSSSGALIAVREQDKAIEVLKWRDPSNLSDVDKRTVNLEQYIASQPGLKLKPINPAEHSPLIYAIARDGSKIAVVVEDSLTAQSLYNYAQPKPYHLENPNVSKLGFTDNKLIVLYHNGTLELHDPENLGLLGWQATSLEDPTGLWTNSSYAAVASFAQTKLQVFDLLNVRQVISDSSGEAENGVLVSGSPFGLSTPTSFVTALSGQGLCAYTVVNTSEVFVKSPTSSPLSPGSSTPATTKLEAPGAVYALAFFGEKLLAAGDFAGIHLLNNPNEMVRGASSQRGIRFLAASPTHLAYVMDDKLYAASIYKGETPPLPTVAVSRFRLWPWVLIGFWALLVTLPFIFLWRRWRHNRKQAQSLEVTTGQLADEGSLPLLPPPMPPEDLVRACATGECVLYGGAGLSASAGFPTWEPFVKDLTAWAIDGDFVEEGLAASLLAALRQRRFDSVADNIVNIMRSRESMLNEHLKEVFLKPASLSPAHRTLNSIQFSAVLTTNFDRLMEDTYKIHGASVYTPKDAEQLLDSLTKRAFFLLKLYGTLERPDTVMVAPAQYDDAIKGNFLFSQFMETLFFSRTLLFIGASLEGIETYLRGISFSRQNLRTHYALVAVTDAAWQAKANPLKARYGIEVLPFSPSNNYQEVLNFLKTLETRVKAETERTKDEDAPTACLNKLVLTNIGPFEHIEIDLNSRWNILLGDNGSGKSTILKAIAISILGEDAKSYAGRLIKSGEPSGEITLITNRNTYRTKLSRKNGEAKVESIPGRPFEAEGWLAIGFPPLRTVSWERPHRGEAETKGRPTPDDLLPLVTGAPDPRLDKLKQWIVNLDYWIKDARSRNLDPSRYERLIDEFFKVVGQLTKGLTIKFKEVKPLTNEVTIITDDGELPIESLSQGMTSLIGWVGILLQRLYEVYGDDEEPRKRYALVLMDEIDAHLHPAWQQSLVRGLEAIFPNIQFISTTHSPLIVGGMQPEQILRFARDEDKRIVQYKVEEEMTLGRADQILTGDLFGLETTFSINQDLEKDMAEYHKLLAKDERGPEEEIKFQKLRDALKTRIPLAGEKPPERKAMDLISALLKDESDDKSEVVNQAIMKKAEKLLMEVGKKKL